MAHDDNPTVRELLRELVIDPLMGFLRGVDPKLVTTAVTFALTYVVTDLLNLGLEDKLIGAGPVNVTWGLAIAFVAAHAAGYWKTNVATILRKPAPDGNPDLALVEKHLGKP